MPNFNLDADAVDTPCIEWARMYTDWELYHDLLGGTRRMRQVGEKWLPKEPKEKQVSYNVRLSRSFLYNGLKDTVKKLTAKPFGRPVNFEEVPEELLPLTENMDLMGSGGTAFGREIFKALATYGLTHIFVDFPTIPEGLNRAQEEAMGVRPFLRHIRPPQLFSWDYTTLPNGKQHLTEIRFKDMTLEREGQWKTKRVHWIYVYRVTSLAMPENPEADDIARTGVVFEMWRAVEEETDKTDYATDNIDWWQTADAAKQREYMKVSEGPVSFAVDGIPTIPIITIYGNRKGYMTAEGPLDDLAWMNLVHWQSFSDQRNILRFARLPQLFASGFTKDDMGDVESMSVQQVWRAKDPQARLQYIEHSGQGVAAGEKDLERLEDRMRSLGMMPLLERTQDRTATGVAVSENRNSSDVMAWIEAAEMGIYQAFQFAANWLGIELDDEFAVHIYSDFVLGISATDMETVLKMRMNGDLSRESFLREAKRRGFLADELDIDEELDRLLEEAAAGIAMVTDGMEEQHDQAGTATTADDDETEEDDEAEDN